MNDEKIIKAKFEVIAQIEHDEVELSGAKMTEFNQSSVTTTIIELSTDCSIEERMDTVIPVTVKVGPGLPEFAYKAVCKTQPEKPRSRDMSAAFALFGIAILVVYVAIRVIP